MSDEFEITEDHIKVIKGMTFEYLHDHSFGAPGLDQKRPFGNSYVYGDLADLLGMEPEPDGSSDEDWSEDQKVYMREVFFETATVLNIIIQTQSFKPGLYIRKNGVWSKQG